MSNKYRIFQLQTSGDVSSMHVAGLLGKLRSCVSRDDARGADEITVSPSPTTPHQ